MTRTNYVLRNIELKNLGPQFDDLDFSYFFNTDNREHKKTQRRHEVQTNEKLT